MLFLIANNLLNDATNIRKRVSEGCSESSNVITEGSRLKKNYKKNGADRNDYAIIDFGTSLSKCSSHDEVPLRIA